MYALSQALAFKPKNAQPAKAAKIIRAYFTVESNI